jgi:putative ABC transport system permease protein
MLWHYFTVAARSLVGHKLYSFINIAGLALGLACVTLIVLFIRYETSYDRWVPDSARLYRIEITARLPGRRGLYKTALTPGPMAKAMQEGVSGVLAATRLRTDQLSLWVGDRGFFESVDVVDPNFFQVIRYPLLAGDPAHVLDQPESVVLSEGEARKFFGNTSAVGRTVSIRWMQCAGGGVDCKERSAALKVTGLMRDLPRNSQLVAQALVPSTSFLGSWGDARQWLSANYYSYVVLAPGASAHSVIAAFRPIMDRDAGPAMARRHLKGRASELFQVQLTPFVDVHLASGGYVQNMTAPGSRVTVYGIAMVGALILLVACFNFMNLATARASLRAREISLRKCVGASRRELMAQLLGESVIMALCALVLALVLVEMLLPAFDRVLDRPIAFHYIADWRVLLVIIGIAAGAGLISGSYPALVLSGLRPGMVLRAGGSAPAGSGRLRMLLVVLQFVVSIGLAIGAIVVARQISFVRQMDLGFDPRDVIVMRTGGVPSTQSFIEALRKLPGVQGAALSDTVPFTSDHPLWLARLPRQTGFDTVRKISIDPSFPGVYHIPLVSGRLLSADREEDTLSNDNDATSSNAGHNILINVAAAERFGYTPEQAIGKTLIVNNSAVHIVGVLGNIKTFGALEPVTPTVYFYDPTHMSILSIRISDRDEAGTLAFIDRTWRTFAPVYSSQRYFLSARYATYYQASQQEGLTLEIFVAVAILIACLGLFGLTVFTAERRTKEIGIRKVSGARTRDIVALTLWRISAPVLVANLIAWPVAYYYLARWLQGYASRISLNPLYFVVAGAAALLIAWATVYIHTLRLARMSPVCSLRYE